MKTWFVILLMVTFVLAGCGAKSSTLNVDMHEFAFAPDHWTVKAGAPVTINLKNSGGLEHDFIILNQGLTAATPFKANEAEIYWKTELDARQDGTLQFTAPSEPGEYEVICGMPGHLEQGMKATLVVEP